MSGVAIKNLILLTPLLFASCYKSSERPASFIAPGSLRITPKVISVEVTPATGKPTRQIIHILDQNFIPRNAFEADYRTQYPDATKEDIQREWSLFLSSVETVQKQQESVLLDLVRSHGITEVYLEYLTEAQAMKYRDMVEKVNGWQDRGGDDAMSKFLRQMNREHRLELGPASRVDGLEVRGAEDPDRMETANPVRDGRVEYDKVAMERRESVIVKNVLAGDEPVVVLILGGGHDLANNLPNGIEVVRIQVAGQAVTANN